MSTISNNERNERSENILANKSVSPSGSILGTAPNPFIEGFQHSPGSTAADALKARRPNPDTGDVSFSNFQVNRITKGTMKRMRRLCQKRGIELDFEYWEKITRSILKQSTPEDAIIVSAPAGSGKSTWIQAFHLALKDLFKNDPELDKAIVGTVIVLQTVNSLNNLAAELNEGCPEDKPFIVVLQGWSESGRQLGYCLNPDVNSYDECPRSRCPYASQNCYILELMQDVTIIPDLTRMEQEDGTVCHFFGNTLIRVREIIEDGKIRLEPVAGDQTACGEWAELPIDRVYGYYTLLERHLNRKSAACEL